MRRFTTISGLPIRRLYTQADLPEDWSYDKYLNYPGQPPYTRGIHATGYRGKMWTMRQFSGFASPEETNQRYKYLLAHGGHGLSVAFDLPTLMGYDSDHPFSEGEVGKCGVAIDSLEDMEILFDGIDLEKTTVSMTINSPASVLWAMYLAVAEKQGADWKKISGTLQNDILKEYIAQKEYIYPPAPSMRLVIDTFEFGSKFTPKFNTDFDQRLSHSRGRLDRAAGVGIHGLRRRGIRRMGAAPRARCRRVRSAAELLLQRAQRFLRGNRQVSRGAQDLVSPDEGPLRCEEPAHLADALPHANGRRLAHGAAADEQHRARGDAGAGGRVWAERSRCTPTATTRHSRLPTEDAVRIALRTQQIIAYESGVAKTVDPLGGSYFVERLTLDMENGAFDYFDKLDAMGGMVQRYREGISAKGDRRSQLPVPARH